MNPPEFGRTEMLIGTEGVELLAQKSVAVFGVGGVGGFVCEALARAGIGRIDLFDDDVVAPSNINRQIVALHSTVGMPKVEVMAQRIAQINPACNVQAHRVFYVPDTAHLYPLELYDYVIDAVDTVSAKVEIICRARQAGVRVITSMGAGNKLHPELFRVANIEETTVCPLARVMRKELRKMGIRGVKAVYSTEVALTPRCQPPAEPAAMSLRPGKPKRIVPGSISFVPAAAGLVLAGAVVRDLLEIEE